jgi:hypothetical protein
VKQRIMLVVVIALNGTTVALAQTQDGQQACMNDAFQFCQDAIPDRERVFQCLVSHKDLISAACHTVMAPSLSVEQPPLTEQQTPHAKSARGKVTFAKRASRAVSRHDQQAPHAKSAKRKATFVKRASKAVSRHDRHPLNLVPH